MPILKRRLNYNNEEGAVQTLYLETSSDMVIRPDGSTVEDMIDGLGTKLTQLKTEMTDEMTAQIAAVIADSPEAFNTLKAFYDWTQEHEMDAASMLASINDLKTRVAALEESKATYQLVAVE